MSQNEIDKRASQAKTRRLNIRLVKMSMIAGARGVAAKDGDGYMVIVNADLTEEEQEQAFIHEMLHIYRGDFESSASVEQIEAERHKPYSA